MHRAPIFVFPSNCTFGLDHAYLRRRSRPNPPPRSAAAGSKRRPPSTHSASTRGKSRSTSAKSTRVLQPSTSRESGATCASTVSPFAASTADRIRQINLFVLVVRLHLRQRRPQFIQREAINARIDLVDLALLGRELRLFDNRANLRLGFPQNAPVTRGIAHHRRQNRRRSITRAMRATSAFNVSVRISGASPGSTTAIFAPPIARRATCIACPVPCCGNCKTRAAHRSAQRQPSPAQPGARSPRPFSSRPEGAHARSTCSTSVRPPAWCSTFARFDFSRVPLPAANTTIARSLVAISRSILGELPSFAKCRFVNTMRKA